MMGRQGSKNLVLAAMIFAVAMMFIDQTIVSIAIPDIEKDLDLSETGSQWIINGYLLALAALFAFGGKLGDVLGHRRMVLVGVAGFAIASALCGAAPNGDLGETWLIVFRIIQGAFGAIMFPAALAIVVGSFPAQERGKALAIFFGVTGGLTSVGPIAGGYLITLTWRAIFWINVPIAIVAIVLTFLAKPADERRKVSIDYRGTVLVSAGFGLAVLGFQQASKWGWDSVATWGCIVAGALLIAAFCRFELKVPSPLIDLRIFGDRGFVVDNVVLFLLCVCFVPLFFFASVYSQLVLGYDAANAGLYLLLFFSGFATASQVGGRILDQQGARLPVIVGSAITAIGFYLWAGSLADADLNTQWYWIVLTGAGMGLVLSPVATDAVNRAPRGSYGEVSGVTQTVRYFASSVGLAILGTVLIEQNRGHLESSLGKLGLAKDEADGIASAVSSGAGGGGKLAQGGAQADRVLDAIQQSFASSTKTVFIAMAAVMALCFVVSLIGMQKGIPEQVSDAVEADAAAGAAAVLP
jgi:EmrB/QacA subfamily drug resistance transporter